jgi:hypothetical protein
MDAFNQLSEHLRAYRISRALFSAYETGLFDALSESPLSETDIIKKIKLSKRSINPLLGFLKSLGIVTVQNSKYQISRDYLPYLSPSSGRYIGNMMAHEIHLSKRWQNLTGSIRSGEPVKEKKDRERPENVSLFINAMSALGKRSAKIFCENVPFSHNETVLDLGGGPGEYQRQLCEKYSDITVTLFDQKETIKVARNTNLSHPENKRMKYIEGDFLNDELNGPYNSIILSNIIHIYDGPVLTEILQKCHHSLQINGRILVKDFIITEETEKRPFSHLFGLHMLLSTDSGKCYRLEELADIMSNAGFAQGPVYQITETSLVIEGHKS